jgi:hypothetical protein
VDDESHISTIDSRVAENVEKINLEFGFQRDQIQKILEKNDKNVENAIHSLFDLLFKEFLKQTNTDTTSLNEENCLSQGKSPIFNLLEQK